jgi:CDP-glycerol glycerophosphotransferase
MQGPAPEETRVTGLQDKAPDVSVVVIVYNDAQRLPAAVESVRDQTLRNLEIVIVNDASTDDTRAVADGLAAADPRVTAVHLTENSGGCSRPRNVGLERVRAPYVMFLDSDDVLERHACKNMLLAMEKHDADVVVGKTRRCIMRGRKIVRQEGWYFYLHKEHQVYTDIRENIRFPEGWLYEDLLFTTKCFATAAKIVILPNLVYDWRVYPNTAQLSITNQRHDIKNFEHRFGILRQIDEFLLAHGRNDLKLTVDDKFVRHDLGVYLQELAGRDPQYQERFLAAAREHLLTIDPRALTRSGIMSRLACHFILRSDLDQLLRVLDYVYRDKKLSAELTERDGRIYWGDVSTADPAEREVLDVTDMGWQLLPLRDLRLQHEVTELSVSGSVLRLRATLRNVLGKIQPGAKIDLRFRNSETKKAVFAPVTVESLDATRVHVSAEVDLNATLPIRSPQQRQWTVNVRVRQGDEVNVSPLSMAHPGAPALPGKNVAIHPRLAVLVGDQVQCHVSKNGNLGLRLVNTSETGAHLVRSLDRVAQAKPVREVKRRGLLVAGRARAAARSQRAKTKAYRLFQRLPIKKGSVVFESHIGRQYSDSPKYIYEALRASGLNYRPIWSYRDSTKSFPTDATLVRRDSWRFYYELARAQYWVDNQGFPRECTKRAGTTYLQTWHGTPLKLMGWDEPKLAALTGAARAEHEGMIARWDHLVVPNEYFVNTFVKSYRYRGNLLRVGYPRNDRLARPTTPDEIAALKTQLGLPLYRPVALYAPTFRPRVSKKGNVPLALDLTEMDEALGEQWMLIVRCHYLERISVPQRFHHFVRNGAYHDDVTDLMLVADVLITDYSSVMFDYSILRRPMIFLVHDYDEYMAHRGTYFDLRAKAPGPLVTTSAEVTACLKDLDAVRERYAKDIEAWADEFAQYERGNAAEMIVRQIFGAGDPR